MNHAIEVWLTYKKLYILQVHNSMGFGGKYTPMEKEMATHSSTLAWRIPWREEPGRLQSMGSQRVGHDWVTSPQWRRRRHNHETIISINAINTTIISKNFLLLSLVAIIFFCDGNTQYKTYLLSNSFVYDTMLVITDSVPSISRTYACCICWTLS